MATQKRLAVALRIVGNINPSGPHHRGDMRVGDVVGIEINDPKNPELDPKTQNPLVLKGDLCLDKQSGPAMRLATPKEAITRLTDHQMRLHGYSEKDIKTAKEGLTDLQLEAHAKMCADEQRRINNEASAKNGVDPASLLAALGQLVAPNLKPAPAAT